MIKNLFPRVSFLTLVPLVCCCVSLFGKTVSKPNMVIFLSDDHSWRDSPVYTNTNIRTPMMESLSKEGLVFQNAFVASPACGPSRAALLSGLMPARNGAEPNHMLPDSDTQTMVGLLQKQGYEVVAFGKIAHGKKHAELIGFDHFKDARREQIRNEVEAYLEARISDKPLCLMVGDHRPHVIWAKENVYENGELELPNHFIDTPETREHWGRYATEITGMDAMIKDVDQLARRHFGSDDYLFLYSADHGAQWPFAKWNLYDAGVRTPLIVRWPGHVSSGVQTEAMVSWIDIMPTLIDIAGGKVAIDIDGRSFAEVLFGVTDEHRSEIFTTHSGDGRMNVYPIRSIRTKRYKYIRNLMPDCYHSNHSDIHRKDGAGAYWDSWDEAAKTDEKAAALIRKYYQRPAEEFYDLDADPTEQTNLAGAMGSKKIMEAMAEKLDRWMSEQGDTKKAFKEPYPLSGRLPCEVVHPDLYSE